MNTKDLLTQLRDHWCPGNDNCLRCLAATSIETRNRIIHELLPFMHNDVRSGLLMADPPADHYCDGCADCDWYNQSKQWQQRIDVGEFHEWL